MSHEGRCCQICCRSNKRNFTAKGLIMKTTNTKWPRLYLTVKLGYWETHVETHSHMLTHGTQRQLHLQQTRPHCVSTLFPFCHCLGRTCSIILSLSHFLCLSLPTWFIPSLAKPVSYHPLFTGCMQSSSSYSPPCVFPVFNSHVLSYAYSSHWQGLAAISSICEPIVAIARLPLSSPPFYLFVSLTSCWLSSLPAQTVIDVE